MRKCIILACMLTVVILGRAESARADNHAPVVSNVTASQQTDGSKKVDIRYDLADADGDTCTVAVQASSDGGATWAVPITAVSGAIGAGITPGGNKQIVWTCTADLPGAFGSQYKVRVCADDGHPSAPSNMVLIPAGEFLMGDSFNEGEPEELPRHAVYVDAFYMDKYKVTNQQYADALNWAWDQGGLITVTSGVVYKYGGTSRPYCSTTPSSSSSRITWSGSAFGVASGMANYPMVEVTADGSIAYANWRSGMEGKPLCYDLSDPNWPCNFGSGYRLPTEAEWEKAARGGATGHRFPWSDTDTIQHARANYNSYWAGGGPYYSYDTSPTEGYHPTFNTGVQPYTSPVGYFAPNDYGIYDMAGNAFEWCNDWFGGTYYSSSPSSNPHGPDHSASSGFHVLRGGSWGWSAFVSRCAARPDWFPLPPLSWCGFRLAFGSNPLCGGSGAFTIDNRSPEIAVDSPLLDFDDSSTQRTLLVWNSGVGTLQYQFQSWPKWVSISPPSGSSTGSGNKITHTVTINRCQLAAGLNQGTIQIVSAHAGNSPKSLSCSATGVAGTVISGKVKFRNQAGDDLARNLIPPSLEVSLWETDLYYQWPGTSMVFENRDAELHGPYASDPPDGHTHYTYSLPTCLLDGNRTYTIAFSVSGSDKKVITFSGSPPISVDVVMTYEDTVSIAIPALWCRKTGHNITYAFSQSWESPEVQAVKQALTTWKSTNLVSFKARTLLPGALPPDILFVKGFANTAHPVLMKPRPNSFWIVELDFNDPQNWTLDELLKFKPFCFPDCPPNWMPFGGSKSLEAAALHEIGHTLGLRYSPSIFDDEGTYGDSAGQQWSIMDYLSCREGATLWLGWSDVKGLQAVNNSWLRFIVFCPVDVQVSDPEGNVVSKTLNQIPGATYIEQDFDGDGQLDDEIIIPAPTTGTYSIAVFPQPGTIQEGNVTVTVEDHGVNKVLLDAVPITELPTEPMTLVVDRTPPTLFVQVTPTALAPCDGSMVSIHVDLQVQDETDPNPQVALAGIVGAWPADPNDIAGAGFGTDDRDFELRATCDGICGQSYNVFYVATDAAKNQTIVSATVSLADDTSGSFTDCNTNSVPDECETKRGTSPDCDADGIPDECQSDSDNDGLIDACDPCPYRRPGDVNGDGLFDVNDLASFMAVLLNPENAAPDERCAADVNGDGAADGLDIQAIMNALLFPEVITRGDLNRDGLVNTADISLFIAVLLRVDTDPYRAAAADVNASGTADGQDIQAFVIALLGG